MLFHVTSWQNPIRLLELNLKPMSHDNPLDFGPGLYFGLTTKFVQHYINANFRNPDTKKVENAAVLVLIVPKDLFSRYPTGYTINSDDEWVRDVKHYLNGGRDWTIAWIEGPMVGNTLQAQRGDPPTKLILGGRPEIQMMVRALELREELSRSPLVQGKIIYLRNPRPPRESV